MSRSDGLFQAFVLHRRDYRDTSLLLEVFANGVGRFPAVARGARRSRGPASALLQPFQPLWLGVVGRGEVRTLTRIEAAGRPLALSGPILLSGFYLNELLTRLLARHDPHDALFAFYQSALAELAGGEHLETTLRQFELRLLEELGYALELSVDAGTREPVQARLSYVYERETGVRAVGPGERGLVVSGDTLLALAAGQVLGPHQVRGARALLREAIEPHLGGHVLRSRELFRRWYRQRPPEPETPS